MQLCLQHNTHLLHVCLSKFLSAKPGRPPSPVAATLKSFSMPKPVRLGDWTASDDEIPLRVLHTPRQGSDTELREIETEQPERALQVGSYCSSEPL